jgi:hypothetical protein
MEKSLHIRSLTAPLSALLSDQTLALFFAAQQRSNLQAAAISAAGDSEGETRNTMDALRSRLSKIYQQQLQLGETFEAQKG